MGNGTRFRYHTIKCEVFTPNRSTPSHLLGSLLERMSDVHSYATEVVGYFTSFPTILSLVDSVCLQVGCIFRRRACSSALEKGFLVSHFVASLSFGVSKLALIFDFDSYSGAKWGCVTVGAPHLWQPEVRTDINHR